MAKCDQNFTGDTRMNRVGLCWVRLGEISERVFVSPIPDRSACFPLYMRPTYVMIHTHLENPGMYLRCPRMVRDSLVSRVCPVGLRPEYTRGILPTQVVRYGLNTPPNAPTWFGTNSIPVSEFGKFGTTTKSTGIPYRTRPCRVCCLSICKVPSCHSQHD